MQLRSAVFAALLVNYLQQAADHWAVKSDNGCWKAAIIHLTPSQALQLSDEDSVSVLRVQATCAPPLAGKGRPERPLTGTGNHTATAVKPTQYRYKRQIHALQSHVHYSPSLVLHLAISCEPTSNSRLHSNATTRSSTPAMQAPIVTTSTRGISHMYRTASLLTTRPCHLINISPSLAASHRT